MIHMKVTNCFFFVLLFISLKILEMTNKKNSAMYMFSQLNEKESGILNTREGY